METCQTEMSAQFANDLRKAGVPENVIKGLHVAMLTLKDPNAAAYAHGCMAAFEGYGIEGLKLNILYMLSNARTWQGPQAKEFKVILNKWASK